ncbi:TadE/TadG family type IV pilus assembly protein [Salidesulfovibrio brasiliensis]|uniref:TadE/TadG family type IV pilus assembly protein n=1 Tax=Salidesulfovibrio brasiliensis TaxID=221711 RepID=UPI0006D06CFE|nr:TadE/TadG family type IV pilus assembly protein [Salidesulfovibrio brasiliensis]
MRRSKSSNKGIAAAELGLVLPFVALLLFLLMEGGNAMHAYSSLVEASREGARIVLLQGEGTSNVEALVRSLVPDLPPEDVSVLVESDEDARTVTVLASYEYQPMIGGRDALEMLYGGDPLVIRAGTTMPLP